MLNQVPYLWVWWAFLWGLVWHGLFCILIVHSMCLSRRNFWSASFNIPSPFSLLLAYLINRAPIPFAYKFFAAQFYHMFTHRLSYFHICLVKIHICIKICLFQLKRSVFAFSLSKTLMLFFNISPSFFISPWKLPNFSLLLIIFINFQSPFKKFGSCQLTLMCLSPFYLDWYF